MANKLLHAKKLLAALAMRLAPLVAIDFLLIRGDMYAIDLNIAPQLSSTGVEKHLRPKQVLSEIKDWYKAFPLSAQAYKMHYQK